MYNMYMKIFQTKEELNNAEVEALIRQIQYAKYDVFMKHRRHVPGSKKVPKSPSPQPPY